MKANKHLLLWSSVGVLILLLVAAVQENFGREWRRLQRQANDASPTDASVVQLRQVVLPAIAVTDRCISCHVGMAAGETGIPGDPALAPHPDVVHDPADFGCTICHAGQGRATEREDAHGIAPHWPEPMIPARYAQAGCGTCHTPLEIPLTEQLASGLRLIERLDCLACHALDGRGGTLRPGAAAGITAPDLSRVGTSGYRVDWYEHHLAEHRSAGSGAWQNSMAPIGPGDRERIDAVLRTRVGAPRLVEAKSAFQSSGCLGCHQVDGVGGDDGPELTRAGLRDPAQTDFSGLGAQRDLSAWFAEHFRSPAQVVPGSLMPAMGLGPEQIELLTLYMHSLRSAELPAAFVPRDRLLATRFQSPQFPRDGEALYRAFCSACHGTQGQGMRYAGMAPFPAIGLPGFLGTASDEFIAATVRRGRPGTRMSAWGGSGGMLDEREIAAVVAHLRELGGVPRPSTAAAVSLAIASTARGRDLYSSTCAGCHGARGEGGEGPSLANRVLLQTASNEFLAETIRRGRAGTTMEAFAEPSVRRRALSDDDILAVVAHIRSWEESR